MAADLCGHRWLTDVLDSAELMVLTGHTPEGFVMYRLRANQPRGGLDVAAARRELADALVQEAAAGEDRTGRVAVVPKAMP
eukprot:13311460-Alexandrium_andersonii.AAC.1